jgi:hypothetical protein
MGMVIFLVSHTFYQIPWFNNQMKPLAFILLISSVALAQAGFVTQPYGDQIVSNEGIVTLPQGGIVRDNKRGFSIDAKYIEYKDNAYLKARNAKLKNTSGQSLLSPAIDYVITDDRMNILGPLSYNDDNVSSLKATHAVAFIDAKSIVAFDITVSSPVIKANAIVFNDSKNEAFLLGNYYFKSNDGKIKQRIGDNAMILLNFTNKNRITHQEGIQIPEKVAKIYTDLITKSR